MTPQTTPTRINLKKDQKLEVEWQDGHRCTYSITYLRSMCPCATCKTIREQNNPHDVTPSPKKKPLLTILPGNYSRELTVLTGEMVGNYALRLEFSDQHGSGIYSFQYLREICPDRPR